ncbi:hypothetical protein JMM81_10575 [Bacillus sp. V3B]|uniref:hypothetical protein n=1 Tax=Bacillus sp. V3B TaxID=2804915 RepID=UPI002108CAEF|nr:hypothetical protein [Bacillus sp. V3B]MCQ6275405.1 hypothetical protein [Bacillus sp. V3B]
MPNQKLTIVPVTLHPDSKKSLPSTSSKDPSTSICTIKTANVEVSFYGGVDEHVIQTVMRELKNL